MAEVDARADARAKKAAATRQKDLESRALRELCPTLRRFLEQELSAGNAVVAIKEDWGFLVLLREPFARNYLAFDSEDDERNAPVPLGEPVTFREVDNRGEWKSEYNASESKHTLACGFGADWKPAARLTRNRALLALFFLFLIARALKDCLR